MIISAKYILKPRKVRRCAQCGKQINGIQVRLYGAAYYGDPPYVVYTDPDCAPMEAWRKLNASNDAVEQYAAQVRTGDSA